MTFIKEKSKVDPTPPVSRFKSPVGSLAAQWSYLEAALKTQRYLYVYVFFFLFLLRVE